NGWKAATGSAGIFDSARAENPFRDWNVIYVPYCTGDVHAGAAEHVDVPGGPTDQMFVGYRNIGAYLQRLVPTFSHADQVVLSGASAGMSGSTFEAGLMEVRGKYILPAANWGSYLIASTSHTWINALSFYNTSVGGVALTSWVDELVNHSTVSHVAP